MLEVWSHCKVKLGFYIVIFQFFDSWLYYSTNSSIPRTILVILNGKSLLFYLFQSEIIVISPFLLPNIVIQTSIQRIIDYALTSQNNMYEVCNGADLTDITDTGKVIKNIFGVFVENDTYIIWFKSVLVFFH